jgi:hypothetical protein
MLKRIAVAIVAAAFAIVALPSAAAADASGSIRGFVRVPLRPPRESVASATVHLIGRNGTFEAQTNDNGFYVMWGVPAGKYRLSAAAEGREMFPAEIICVHAGEDSHYDTFIGATHVLYDFVRIDETIRPNLNATTDLYSIGDC